MIWLRRIRYVLWSAVGIAGFVAIAVMLGWWTVDGPGARATRNAAPASIAEIGGSFTMTDHRGRTVTDRDIRGKPTMMFFGFTSCPDVCPTTLSDMAGWLEELGPAADGLNVVFVSVDPARDTVEQMAAYLSLFDPRILGLTGTPAQLEAMARNYRFYYRRVPLDGGGYTMDHTAMVYLLNQDGRFASTIDYHEDRQTALPKLRRLLGIAPAG
ncbi:MAG: SCO family protein [Defluviicoccus sp.]|nr:SCO family protein [Defluviicoccus sp.]MDG4591554.1 SCO family protein [Defluviicoccus sp.]